MVKIFCCEECRVKRGWKKSSKQKEARCSICSGSTTCYILDSNKTPLTKAPLEMSRRKVLDEKEEVDSPNKPIENAIVPSTSKSSSKKPPRAREEKEILSLTAEDMGRISDEVRTKEVTRCVTEILQGIRNIAGDGRREYDYPISEYKTGEDMRDSIMDELRKRKFTVSLSSEDTSIKIQW